MGIVKVISGGQTGVDRAALDLALELGLPCGGWCPKGRRAQDGRLADHYPLTETDSANYHQRTQWNVRDSDATLVLNSGLLEGGTDLTVQYAAQMAKPCLVLRLDDQADRSEVIHWIEANAIQVLNIAGPREEKRPGIYRQARGFLQALFDNR